MRKGVKMRLNKDFWLFNRPIAHRGLWGNEIIENSLPAYQNAIDNGYPIEIDLYSSKDGVLFCFHDDTLVRMTGAYGKIFEKTAKELKQLRLSNTDYEIPTFDQVLALVDGKVPLLIELKDQPDKNYVQTVVERLKSYKGEFALQSFNPILIKKVKELAPQFIRGILGSNLKSDKLPAYKKFVVKNMPLNFIIKPDFISYDFNCLPLKKRLKKRYPVITWTLTNQQDCDKIKPFALNVIFEHFIPKW